MKQTYCRKTNVVFLDRLNRKNIGARATGKALLQILNEINVQVIQTFDTDISIGFDLTRSVDDIERDIFKFAKTNEKISNLLSALKKADALVINGEGSFIFIELCHIVRLFLAFMKIAKKYNCRTYILNSEAAFGSQEKADERLMIDVKCALKYVDLFVLRSPKSFEFANKYLTQKAHYVPDALFSWIKYFEQGLEKPLIGDSIVPFPDSYTDFGKFDFNNPYICISDSSILDYCDYDEVVPNYVELINRLKLLKPDYQIYLVETGAPGKPFLDKIAVQVNIAVIPVNITLLTMQAILGNAELFISGRWHPAIMATLNGTPCVLTDANCHKTEAFVDMMDLNIQQKIYSSKLDKPEDLDMIIKDCLAILENKTLKNTIKNKAKKLAEQSLKIKDLIEIDRKNFK